MNDITERIKMDTLTFTRTAVIYLLLMSIPTLGFALPDLAVSDDDIVATPKVAQIGQVVIFEVTVVNQGDGRSGQTYVELDLTLYGEPANVLWVGVADLLPLNPGQKVTVTITGGRGYSENWIPDSNGIYIAAVNVDPEYAVPDPNRDNNRAGTSVQVGIPDLEVVSVNIISASTPPRIGETVTIEATIRNNTSDGPYPTYVECEINRYRAPDGAPPVFVGTHEFTIDGNETITVTIDDTWTPTENWLYIIAVIVDPPYAYPDYEHDHGDIIETEGNDTYKDDEGIHFANNAQWTAVQVGVPDFEVVSVNITSEETPFRPGNPVIIEATIRNNNSDGPYPTYVECEINLFRAPDGTPPAWIGTHEITINGNETITVTIENTTDDDYPDGPWIPSEEDLYIIAVIVDPPYAYPDYEHDHGDIIETEDTYKDDEGIHFANNAQWDSRCVYANIPPDPGDSHTWLTGSLVENQEGPGYLLRSFGVDSCIFNAYAYDQALGIIALTALEDYDNAQKILVALNDLQEEDGSFLFVWHAPRPKSVELEVYEKKMVGTNAWIVMAINFYTMRTQDESYLEMAKMCADWILSLQDDDGGIFGGMGDPRIFKGMICPDRTFLEGEVTWKSIEHNLDAYSGLYFLSQLVSDPDEQEKYETVAQKVKEWLYTNWLDDEGRFRRGIGLDENCNDLPDDYMITDTNTWGILALGPTGPNGEDYTRGLQWCLLNTILSEEYERCDGKVVTVEGFDVNLDPNSDYDDNPEFIAGGPHTGDGLDTVWTEGTLGAVLAFYEVNDCENYYRFLGEMAKTQCTNGGIPYSTSVGSAGEYISDRDFDGFVADGYDDTDRTSTFLSVAGTAWYIIAANKINPFQTSKQRTYGDVSGNGEVTSFDAALILQEVVGLIDLPDPRYPNFIKIADVSGNCVITAYDAALVLQRTVGLIDIFPIEDIPIAPPVPASHRSYTLTVPHVTAHPGDIITIPIMVDDITNLFSAQFSLIYDSTLLRAIAVSKTNLIKDYTFVPNRKAEELTISLASARALKGSGAIAKIEFEVQKQAPIGNEIPLMLKSLLFNEGAPVTIKTGAIEILPVKNHLYQNYPNPFNPETWIPYQLKEPAEVTIQIYNVKGELVRTLALGTKPVGSYLTRHKAALWNGKNEAGEHVSSGIYFYTIWAGDFSATRRMILLK